MPKKILICGSRYTNADMLDKVTACVHRVAYYTGELIVGDAVGIDGAVVERAEALRVPYMTYGVWRKARNDACYYTNIYNTVTERIAHLPQSRRSRARLLYTERDKWMVEQADVVICIWNGISKGTQAVFEYAQARGVDAVLCDPRRKTVQR